MILKRDSLLKTENDECMVKTKMESVTFCPHAVIA